LPCLFNCGGHSPPAQTVNTTTVHKTDVITNVTGAPISISIGSDFLKPLAQAFTPISEGVQQGIQTLSDQAQSISNQSQSIAEFTKKSNAQLNARQADVEKLVKLMLAVTLAGLGYQFIRSSGRA
jgi:methyl-accepting chemotaxis protein